MLDYRRYATCLNQLLSSQPFINYFVEFADVIAIRYNDKTYELRVLETRPGNAVSIIECDMDVSSNHAWKASLCDNWVHVEYFLQVEFAAPEDYVEPIRPKAHSDMETEDAVAINDTEEALISFVPFVGAGNR